MQASIGEDAVARMRGWRHHLHAHPELAWREADTADFVAVRLAEMGISVSRGLAGTGVVGTLAGRHGGEGGKGRRIGLRAELDALPIHEATGLPYASTRPGIMHACGHDGHMAMLLGAAEQLARDPDFAGTVDFIFQPAEENEGGAVRMVADGLFDRHPVDAVYAVHNWPGLAHGVIAVKPGPMMARFDTFEFTVTGQGGHAAMPQQLRDPVVAAGALIGAINSVVSRNLDPFEQAVVSTTILAGGSVHNVVPDTVTVAGSVRSFEDDVQALVERRLQAIAAGIGAAHAVTIDLAYSRRFAATTNSEREALLAQAAARRVPAASTVATDFRPSMGSEDFSEMLKARPGAFAWIGAGAPRPSGGLHQAGYDFDDSLLGIGAAYFVAVVAEELGKAG
jgi:hippurate hydrolase